MTAIITIYKEDGALQGHPEIEPRPLAVDAAIIAALGVTIVGEGRHEKLPIFIIALVGAPTGWVNAFDIDQAGLTRHHLFLLSGLGFKVWSFDAPKDDEKRTRGDEDPFPRDQPPFAPSVFTSHVDPERIADLVGYVVRVYKTGDGLTRDYRLDRVNFELDPNTLRIIRHWFG